jgi:ABC-type multidrug transport system ATPase subunit
LDEPTSGLDSYQATQIIETLRKLADQGKTIVAVIHQPSQHTFQLFDDLLLISEGKLMYYGERSKVRDYMSDLGYGCEQEVGTAEHVLDCVSRVVGADTEAEKESIQRIETIAKAADSHAREWVQFDQDDKSDGDAKEKHAKKMKHIVDLTTTHPGTNVFHQFKLLFGRSVQETLRGKAAIIIKVVQQVTLGVIYGGIYTLGDNQVRAR